MIEIFTSSVVFTSSVIFASSVTAVSPMAPTTDGIAPVLYFLTAFVIAILALLFYVVRKSK